MEKPDFVGRTALERLARIPRERSLLALTFEGARAPEEGAQLFVAGAHVGNVTSSRYLAGAREGRGPRLGAAPGGLAAARRRRAGHARRAPGARDASAVLRPQRESASVLEIGRLHAGHRRMPCRRAGARRAAGAAGRARLPGRAGRGPAGSSAVADRRALAPGDGDTSPSSSRARWSSIRATAGRSSACRGRKGCWRSGSSRLFPFPERRPAFLQGAVAGGSAKLLMLPGVVLLLVPFALRDHVERRLREVCAATPVAHRRRRSSALAFPRRPRPETPGIAASAGHDPSPPSSESRDLPARAPARGELRRRDHRRRRARSRDRLLPGARARRAQGRGARALLHRLGRHRAEHHGAARQLQDAGDDPLLSGELRALPYAVARSSTSTCCARSADCSGWRTPRRSSTASASARCRTRSTASTPSSSTAAEVAEVCPRARHDLRRRAADPRRGLSPAGLDHPPRRRGLGLCRGGRSGSECRSTRASR